MRSMLLVTGLVSELAVAMPVAELVVAEVALVVTVAAPATILGVAVEFANAVGVRQYQAHAHLKRAAMGF